MNQLTILVTDAALALGVESAMPDPAAAWKPHGT
jgi:hypothetical protein